MINCLKEVREPSVVAHTWNPNAWEAETGGARNQETTWATEWYSKTLSSKYKEGGKKRAWEEKKEEELKKA